jgi:FtsP/CotA-like multicopper oxidase with cupredoxin domain
MYLPRDASKARVRAAQKARDNRAEIVKALSQGQVTRRELFKWGIFTSTGALALKGGLSPFAPAFAKGKGGDDGGSSGKGGGGGDIPTGTPRSPLFGVLPFTQPMTRLNLQKPKNLRHREVDGEFQALWPDASGEPNSKRLSWHTDFNNSGRTAFINPLTGRGPMEGRPPGEFFAHQRWDEFFPKKGVIMTMGRAKAGVKFHPGFPDQKPDAVWTFNRNRAQRSVLPPPLIKVNYGEPMIFRHYNALPVNPTQNGGFGSNNQTTHNHNAHNASASDGASNAQFFPGQFYDYHWSTCMARHDFINRDATDPRCSGPDGNGGLINIPGDWREIQGTLWAHDHRFFFTAENVYKGHLMMLNYYSGRDRGNETLNDGVNLRLPSGSLLDSGNLDFDVNLIFSDYATDPTGQLFFDIFDTDGFLGDNLLTNFAHYPYMEVLPRKYRFRILCGCMSRFIQMAFADANGNPVPFQMIANDGNLLVNPITLTQLDEQGVAERYDIVIDFSRFRIGDKAYLVNLLQYQNDGRKPDETLSLRTAFSRNSEDPAVGPTLEFRVVDQLESVDVPGVFHRSTDADPSQVPLVLTEQIPLVQPVRTRVIEWVRGGDNPRDASGAAIPISGGPGIPPGLPLAPGQCIPDCGDREDFPWAVRVNGQEAHTLNATRTSVLIPRPGEIEHWTYINGGGGWDHPIHLHFEEGITFSRGQDVLPVTERLVRKDVWRLRPSGQVSFQIQFGEFGGAYVNHCHNTVHEDNAMLLRYDILTPDDGRPQVHIIPTPNPTPDGVTYLTPEILPEADPDANPQFFGTADASGGGGTSGGKG